MAAAVITASMGAVDASAAAENGRQRGEGATLKTMCVASGRAAFLEKEYLDLKYAGVKDVVPGMLAVDTDSAIEGVCVSYDAGKLSHEMLMRTYWRRSDPTQTGGQFKEKGARYQSAVWVNDETELEEVEANIGRLERSGILGKDARIVTRVISGPATIEAFPERGALIQDPKAFEKDKAVRTKEFNKRWGFVQYCANRVCGYVRFAPECTNECLEVFPEYVERNANAPPLASGDIKITGRS